MGLHKRNFRLDHWRQTAYHCSTGEEGGKSESSAKKNTKEKMCAPERISEISWHATTHRQFIGPKNSRTLALCTGTPTIALQLGPTAGMLDSWQWKWHGRCCISVQLGFKIASTLTHTFKIFQHIFPTGNFLGGILLATKIDFTRDAVSAGEEIALGVVAATTKTWEKYWQK